MEPLVDDFYFSALFDDDEQFPISDEKYAEELSLQEALMSAIPRVRRTNLATASKALTPKVEIKREYVLVPTATTATRQKYPVDPKGKRVKLEPGCENETAIAENWAEFGICMDAKPSEEMFRNEKCSHSFCSECISRHVATKIQDDISSVMCPAPNCRGVLEPQQCSSVVPRQVFERWGNALCESVVLGSKKLYCPFQDCSAMVVDDGPASAVTVSECPSCHRMFCARCKVPWHVGKKCRDLAEAARKEKGSEKEKENEKLVLALAKKKKWRRCPGCNFFVEKKEGCLHISCRCGNQFCYGCGSKWSSDHVCRRSLNDRILF